MAKTHIHYTSTATELPLHNWPQYQPTFFGSLKRSFVSDDDVRTLRARIADCEPDVKHEALFVDPEDPTHNLRVGWCVSAGHITFETEFNSVV